MSDKDQPRDDAPPTGPLEKGDDAAALEEAFFDEDKMAAIKAELEAEADEDGGFGDAQELDDDVEGADELARIMAPKRAVRHPIVATVVICASLFGMYWLWEDLRFFLQSSKPRELGQASQAVKDGKLKHNTYVTLRGRPIMQTLAINKQRSYFGKTRSEKVYWFVLKDTQRGVLISTRKSLIVDKHKPGMQFKLRRLVFTGRLRQIGNTKGAKNVRRYYRRQSRVSRELRRQFEFAGAELLRHAGKTRATLTDVRGRKLEVKQDTLMEIKVAFPGEHELRVHTDMKVSVPKVIVQGGKGAPRCGALDKAKKNQRATGFGGSLYFKHDPKVVSFAALHSQDLVARDGTAAEDKQPPVDGADLIVGIPPGTVVFNAQKRDCTKACQWAGPSCKKSCSEAPGVQITKNARGLIPVASGGPCGGHTGERHALKLQGQPYRTAGRAVAYVKSLGVPYKLVEDATKSGRDTVSFVLRLTPDKLAALMKQEKREAPYSLFNVDVREEFFFVQWRYVKRQGGDLVITRTRKGFPTRYETHKGTDGRVVLTPQSLGSSVRIAAKYVIRADTTVPFDLSKNAFILEEGVRPSSMWSEPFLPGVPIFYLLMAAFVLLNLLAIRAYFRG